MINFKEFFAIFPGYNTSPSLFWAIFDENLSPVLKQFSHHWDVQYKENTVIDHTSRYNAMKRILDKSCNSVERIGKVLKMLVELSHDRDTVVLVSNNICKMLENISFNELYNFLFNLIQKVRFDLDSDDVFITTLELLLQKYNKESSTKAVGIIIFLLIYYSVFDQKYSIIYELYDITNPENVNLYGDLLSLSDYFEYSSAYDFYRNKKKFKNSARNDIITKSKIIKGRSFFDFLQYHIKNNPSEITIIMQSGKGDRDQMNLLTQYLMLKKGNIKIVINSENAASEIRKYMVDDEYALDFKKCANALIKLGLNYEDHCSVYITDIPILHSIINVKYSDSSNDSLHLHVYTYNDSNFSGNFRAEFNSKSDYYNRYQKEAEYIFLHSRRQETQLT